MSNPILLPILDVHYPTQSNLIQFGLSFNSKSISNNRIRSKSNLVQLNRNESDRNLKFYMECWLDGMSFRSSLYRTGWRGGELADVKPLTDLPWVARRPLVNHAHAIHTPPGDGDKSLAPSPTDPTDPITCPPPSIFPLPPRFIHFNLFSSSD